MVQLMGAGQFLRCSVSKGDQFIDAGLLGPVPSRGITGPHDARYLLEEFVGMMVGERQAISQQRPDYTGQASRRQAEIPSFSINAALDSPAPGIKLQHVFYLLTNERRWSIV